MNDRIEQADQTPAVVSSALGRREMLKRTGFVVGAAAFWATPLVQTIGMRPAAATDLADFCPTGTGETITQMTISYTGDGCDVVTDGAAAGAGCSSPGYDGAGALPDPAFIEVYVGSCGGGSQNLTSGEVRAVGEVFDSGITGSGSQACTTMVVYDEEGGTELARTTIHTSCSQEINIGEQYGPIRIEGGTGTWET